MSASRAPDATDGMVVADPAAERGTSVVPLELNALPRAAQVGNETVALGSSDSTGSAAAGRGVALAVSSSERPIIAAYYQYIDHERLIDEVGGPDRR